MKVHGKGWRSAWVFGVMLPLMLTVIAARPLLAADVHNIHVRDAAIPRPCADCHVGSNHDASLGGGDGTIDVPGPGASDYLKFVDGTDDTVATYYFSGGDANTCSNVDCHFGKDADSTGGDDFTSAAVPGDTTPSAKCGVCHPGTGDVDNYTFGDGTVARIDSTEWGFSGHGLGSVSTYDETGNSGAGLANVARLTDPEGCAYCHDFIDNTDNDLTDHDVSTNPFRLANWNVLGGGWNDACLICHSSGDSGYDPDDGSTVGDIYASKNSSKNVDQNHAGAKHTSLEGGQLCWDCHDPHGDSPDANGNIFMVHAGDGSTPGRGVSLASDGTYGVPTTSKEVDFTTKTIPGDLTATSGYYVELTGLAPYTGICQACHDPTKSTTESTKYWRWSGQDDPDGAGGSAAYASDHNETAVCTSCHTHDNSFAAGCTDCHGDDSAGSLWPDGNSGNNPGRPAQYDYADDAGAHQAHVDLIYNANSGSLPGSTVTEKKNATCEWCHPGSPPVDHPDDATSGSQQAELTRMDTTGDGFTGPPSPPGDDYWLYVDGANATTGTATYFKSTNGSDDTLGYFKISGGTRSCSQIQCHGRNDTPAWYGSSDIIPPTIEAGTLQVDGVDEATGPSFQEGEKTSITLTATADDSSTGGSTIAAAEYFVGTEETAGTGTPMNAQSPPFDQQTEALTATIDVGPTGLNWTEGFYTLFVDARDAAGNWGPTAAESITVEVTARDNFSVQNTKGGDESVSTGATGVMMQQLDFDVTGAGNVDLISLEVEGTRDNGTGDVATDVSQVKIYREEGTTPGFQPLEDTFVSSGFLNASTKKATIDVTGETISGVDTYFYITYDISSGATAGDRIGARLTAMTYGPTGNLTTVLPVPAAAENIKTIFVGGDSTKPTVINLRVDDDPSSPVTIIEGTASIVLTADASDTQNNIVAGEYFVGTEGDAGTGTAMAAQDGAFDSSPETLTVTIDTSLWTNAVGTYTLYVDAKDGAGNWGPDPAEFFVVNVDPKDEITVTGQPGSTDVARGSTDNKVLTLQFQVTGGGMAQGMITGIQLTGTKCPDNTGICVDTGAATGDIFVNVSAIKIYDDSGTVTGDLDAGDLVVGTGFFNSSDQADFMLTTPLSVPVDPASAYLHLTYDISMTATIDDRIGATVTGFTIDPTDTVISIVNPSSDNIKRIIGDSTPPDPILLAAATGSGYGEVELSWNAVGDNGLTGTASVYDIRYSTADILDDTDFGDATQVVGEPSPQISGTPESMTVGNLTAGDTYFFAIKAGDTVPNWGALSTIPSAAAKTDTFPPAFGGLVSATNMGTGGAVNMTWAAATENEGSEPVTYRVYYNLGTTITDWNTWQTTTQSGTGYTVTGLTDGQEYAFGVRAADSATTPNFDTNTTTFTATPTAPSDDTTPPDAVTMSPATTGANHGEVDLTWTAGFDDGDTGTATYYDIRYSTADILNDTDFGDATQVVGEPSPGTESMTVTGLTGGATYFFAIKAGDEVPNWSAVSSSTSAAAKTDTFPPTFGGLVSATNQGTGGAVNLAWAAATENEGSEPVTYRVYYNLGTTIADWNTWQTTTQSSTGFTVTGLTDGQEYAFGVRAADSATTPNFDTNTTTFTATPTAPSDDTTPPDAVTMSPATGGANYGEVDLTWTAGFDDGDTGTATYYDIRYSTADILNDTDFGNATQVVGEPSPGTESMTVTGLQEAQTYFFAIKAGDEVPNWSAVSTSTSATATADT
ncbi:fibronectin type III domain-containing protein, partial [bacterium]|nr:fibronectin type III domain-containing protein [bacterium]